MKGENIMEDKSSDLKENEVVEEIRNDELDDEKKKEIENQEESRITQPSEDSKLEPTTLPREDLSVSQVLDIIIDADKKLNQLLKLFEEKILKDESKVKLFSNLYEDLTRYKEDFIFKNITKQIFMNVIYLFDRVDDLLKDSEKTQFQPEDLIAYLKSFRNEIIQTLKKQDVNIIEKKTEKFDPNFQDAKVSNPVSDPKEDQKIIEVLRKGFTYQDKILRPEEIIVGIYKPKKEVNENG